MIKEINGRWTCSDCDYEWSATAGDNEIPELCDNCYLDDMCRTNGLHVFQVDKGDF